jgi:hypothetical protein
MSRHLGSHGRLATPGDFERFYGRPPPDEWFGVLGERNGVILGMGSAVWDKWGRAWLFFNRGDSDVSAFAMHRLALWVMNDLRKTFQETTVHAFCDATIPGAEKWLRRLGFEPAPEIEAPVMIWKAQCQD